MASKKRGDGGKKPRKSGRSSKDLVDHQLMKVLAKPERTRILAILAERVASPKEIAAEMNLSLSTASYHVTVLRDYELVELVDRKRRRGAVEHFYRAVCPTLLPPDAWEGLPPAMRKGASARILQEFLDDAANSMEAGIFEDPASDLSWTPLVLDQLGIERIGQLADDFLRAVIDAQAEGKQTPGGYRETRARSRSDLGNRLPGELPIRSQPQGRQEGVSDKEALAPPIQDRKMLSYP